MVAGLTIGKKKYAAVEAEMREIGVRAAGLGNTLAALVRARRGRVHAQSPRRTSFPATTRRSSAPGPPQSTKRCSARPKCRSRRRAAAREVAELALAVAERGNTNAVTDAGVAALLAEAGCVGASYNVRINVVSLADRTRGEPLAAEAGELVARTRELARRTTDIVERALGA